MILVTIDGLMLKCKHSSLRTSLEHKFRLMESKGSIWEEISEAMNGLGYKCITAPQRIVRRSGKTSTSTIKGQ
ncbi:hypothetical protein JHK84_042074 [Glycine max]|nr:hypothetical protein JHK84_042074 [Glycine max]